MTTTTSYSPGLEGVVAGETKLSFVNSERSSLMYRGYDIRDLAEHSSFEEVAYLLLYDALPNATELTEFNKTLLKYRTLAPEIVDYLKKFPQNANPMDMLKAGVAILSLYDSDVQDISHEANLRKAIRLIAQFPALITYSYRLSKGQSIIEPSNTLGHAANFLYMLNGQEPDAETARLFDVSLIAYIDHGFNASTFSARVTTSTLSDMHSGIVAAIGALKGPLHGGANEEAMKMLLEIESPDKAEAYIMDAIANKKKIMGFGHRAYKKGDPRATMLTEMAKSLCERTGNMRWYETAMNVQNTMQREKNIFPNVDFPTAYVYYILGLPIEIYTPIFALARIAGWSAHVIEQQDHNRLIRPNALYEGPQYSSYTLISQR